LLLYSARRTGFTLDEIRRLFVGFAKRMPVSERWRKLSQQKITELESMQKEIQGMQRLLRDMMAKCHCDTVEQCGRGIFRSDFEPKRSATNREHPRKIRRT